MNNLIKNLKIISCLSLLFLFFGTAQGMAKDYNYYSFAKQTPLIKLVEDHYIGEELQEVINNHFHSGLKKEIAKQNFNEFPWLPGYAIKSNVSRVRGAALINTCAQECNYNVVSSLTKKLYMSPWGILYVIEPKLESCNNLFTLKQIQQIYKVSKKTGYFDIHEGNIVNTPQGIAHFIDTERFAFFRGITADPYFKKLILNRLIINMSHTMEPSAKQWVLQKINKYKLLAKL